MAVAPSVSLFGCRQSPPQGAAEGLLLHLSYKELIFQEARHNYFKLHVQCHRGGARMHFVLQTLSTQYTTQPDSDVEER
jgi:hypothetical protein